MQLAERLLDLFLSANAVSGLEMFGVVVRQPAVFPVPLGSLDPLIY